MADKPAFVSTPIVGAASISTANTGRDGSGTTGLLATGAAGGTRIDSVSVVATATTTAGMVRLFLDTGGGTAADLFLISEISVTAVTPSATVKAFAGEMTWPRGLVLPSGYKLCVSTEKAEAFDVTAYGGNF